MTQPSTAFARLGNHSSHLYMYASYTAKLYQDSSLATWAWWGTISGRSQRKLLDHQEYAREWGMWVRKITFLFFC